MKIYIFLTQEYLNKPPLISNMTKQRVQKIIAASGLCSRRKAEELIDQGKVTVNGEKITLGDQADVKTDRIMVGKQLVEIPEHLYLVLHKPSGYLTTRSDLWDRKDIMGLIDTKRPVYPVGRLDRDARGILLLTSDGDFSQAILHPSNKTTKTYQVTLDKPLKKESLAQVNEGVKVDSRKVHAKIRKIKPKLVELTIHEGRNKIVKRYFKALGYNVNDLKRVAIGNLRLDISEGKWRSLSEEEKADLLKKPVSHKMETVRKPRPSSFSLSKENKKKRRASPVVASTEKKPFVSKSSTSSREKRPFTSRAKPTGSDIRRTRMSSPREGSRERKTDAKPVVKRSDSNVRPKRTTSSRSNESPKRAPQKRSSAESGSFEEFMAKKKYKPLRKKKK